MATLGFDYNSRTAWVDEVSATPDPATYDLCSVHVSRFTPPLGWTTRDLRLSPSRPLLEAAQEEEEVPASPGIGDFIQRQPPPEVAAAPRCSRALPESSEDDGVEPGDRGSQSVGQVTTQHATRAADTGEADDQEDLPIAAAAGAHQSLLDLS